MQLYEMHFVVSLPDAFFKIHIHCPHHCRIEQARVQHAPAWLASLLRWSIRRVVVLVWIRVVLRCAEALGYQLSEESSERWHGYAYMGFVEVAYLATALRRTQETTMVLKRSR
jgi:hypothetical protein